MDLQNLKVIPVHKHAEYMEQCCQMINEEWPRSETARMLSLEASCDSLPTSLILVTQCKKVIGHCKLTAIPSMPESCFIESVVISKPLRGRKLGTFLMREAEDYCREFLRLKSIHLSTKGQTEFYYKLGYKVCAPVSIFGGICFSLNASNDRSRNIVKQPNNNDKPAIVTDKCVPPPPRPPPMPNICIQTSNNVDTKKTYMSKIL